MPEHLVSMKITKKEKKFLESPISADTPKFPWGLEINLQNEELAKLGITVLPELGTKGSLIANVTVTRASESEDQRNGKTKKSRSLTLQITDLKVDAKSETAANIIFKES